MLHVDAGYAVRSALRHAEIPGEIIHWYEMLYAGPVPAGLSPEAMREMRAAFLVEVDELDRETLDDWLAEQDAALERFREHEEVLLWMGAGMSDQLLLIHLLDWFAGRERGRTKVSVVSAREVPGVPTLTYSLGVLNSEELASLFPQRVEVGDAHLRLAQAAWAAFQSPDPREIERVLQGGTAALPYLEAALTQHLQQFPSVRNGLSRVEDEALGFCGQATTIAHVVDLLWNTASMHASDSFLAWSVDALSRGRYPAVETGEMQPLPYELGVDRMGATVRRTAIGRELLAGRADWVRLNGIDRWLGGVHLQGNEAAWRWSEDARRLVRAGEG